MEGHVRKHGEVAAAHRLDRHAAHAGQERWRGIAMHRLRVLFVERHQHRPLLTRLVVVRDREDPLQLVAAPRGVVEQDPVSPGKVRLLRIGVGDLRRVGEVGTRDAQVREFGKRFPGVYEAVASCRANRTREGGVIVHQRLQRAIGEAGEAGLLGVLAIRGERHRFRQVDLA